MEKFYKYVHSNYNVTTVGDFLKGGISIASSYSNRIAEFLAIKGESEETNRKRLFAQYEGDESAQQAGKPDSELLLKYGTVFYIPFNKLDRDAASGTIPDLVAINNLGAYIAPKLAELINNPSYQSDFINQRGSYRSEFNDASVVFWSRALDDNSFAAQITDLAEAFAGTSFTNPSELQGDFINASPFVEKIDTNVTKQNGGKFSITIAPILAKKVNNSWNIDKNSVQNYLKADSNTLSYSQLRKSNTIQRDERENYFFERVLQPNDLVFLSFEKTKNENRGTSVNSYSSQLAQGQFDMIGMIDSVDTIINSENNTIEIVINGRDLVKTIIEDGTYFFPEAFGMDSIFARQSNNDKLIQRVFGELQTLAAYVYRTIEFSIGFVITQLQNTGYVPDSVFTGWGVERNAKLTTNNKRNQQNKKINKDFREADLFSIKRARDESRISLANRSEENKEAQKTYNLISDLISNGNLTLPSEPSVLTQEAVNALNGNLFDTSVVSPSLDKGIVGAALSGIVGSKKNSLITNNIQRDFASGVWQIIDINIESTVQDRLIVDSSISTASGSLINFVKKICQEPFIEFFTDTYGNKFSFNIRKAPFDEKGYKDLVKNTINFENGVGVITSRDVYSEDLNFNDESTYTWFVLRPKGHLMGFDEFSLAYLPAIYIEEYVTIWGSRPLDITSNYVPLLPKESEKKVANQFAYDVSAFRELKFLIDINSYLPFVRSGSITIKGDRRFKVGCAIYYEATDEYYQITGVTQSFLKNNGVSERVTILQLERGMKRRYFDKNNNSEGFSYFDIVSTTLNESTIRKSNSKGEVVFNRDLAKDWRVKDKNQFNFFLKRLQF
jgi:hypothetical protein